MTEQELMMHLDTVEAELSRETLKRFCGVNIYKEDFNGEEAFSFTFNDFFYDIDESRETFAAALFDLSLAYEVREMRFSAAELDLLVVECRGVSNLTADTIEKMLSLVLDKEYFSEINK